MHVFYIHAMMSTPTKPNMENEKLTFDLISGFIFFLPQNCVHLFCLPNVGGIAGNKHPVMLLAAANRSLIKKRLCQSGHAAPH